MDVAQRAAQLGGDAVGNRPGLTGLRLADECAQMLRQAYHLEAEPLGPASWEAAPPV